ncbi:hypothetical protein [Ekhidna sp.]
MNKLKLTLIGLSISIASFAQETVYIGGDSENISQTAGEKDGRIWNLYPDTIRMTVDDVEIIFAFDRISNKSNYYTDELWKSALNVMENAIENSSIEGGRAVTYRKIKKDEKELAKVEVTPLITNETYLIGVDGVQEYAADRVEFSIVGKDLFVYFSLNDLSQLSQIKDIKIESLWQQIDQKYTNEGSNNLYTGKGKFSYGNAQVNELGVLNTRADNIEITFLGIGLGYYRDRFVPDLGSKIAFNIHDRLGNEWLEFGFLYTQQYFFSRDTESSDYDLDLNGWLNGYGKLNFGKTKVGLGIGSLIHRDGDFFQGSTWKLSIYADDDNSNFSFSPELIFTDDFKSVFPALRVGLTF